MEVKPGVRTVELATDLVFDKQEAVTERPASRVFVGSL
jgi:hypothetical protein